MFEKRIDIFRLHDPKEDKRAISWICVKGSGIEEIIQKAVREILMSENPKIYIELEPKFRKEIINKYLEIYGSQEKMATTLGVSQQTISKWYLGKRKIPLYILKNISKDTTISEDTIKRNIKSKIFDYKKTISRFSLAEIIAKKLHCSSYIVWQSLSKRKWIPIPIILELLKIWKEKTKKQYSGMKDVLKEIKNKTEFLKLNNPASKPIKCIKNLDINLCKILGAFAADGNLYLQTKLSSFDSKNLKKIIKGISRDGTRKIYFDKGRKCWFFQTSDSEIINKIKNKKYPRTVWISFSYKITLREQYKYSVKIFSNWYKDVFGIKLIVRKSKGENEWFVVTTNKILGRYLNLFGFPIGKKSKIVNEPLIVKNSNHEHRKAFALGVMTFDGSVTLDGMLKLMVKSQKLRDSIVDIFSKEFGKNNLTIGFTKRGEYFLQTKKTLPIESMKEFIENGTVKYKRLEMLLNISKINQNNLKTVLTELEGNNVKLRYWDVFEILKKQKELDIYSLRDIVKNNLDITVSTQILHRILMVLCKTKFVDMGKYKVYHKTASYRNIYKFREVCSNENR